MAGDVSGWPIVCGSNGSAAARAPGPPSLLAGVLAISSALTLVTQTPSVTLTPGAVKAMRSLVFVPIDDVVVGDGAASARLRSGMLLENQAFDSEPP